MKIVKSLFLFCAGLSILSANGSAQKAPAESLENWRASRFGMFIHWGPVSLTEKEISWSRANTNKECPNEGPTSAIEYDQLYKQFNPVQFNAKEWVAIAQAAGMKYMILTAKHCDGFLLWDSKVDDYNIMNTPFGRDVCAELAGAAHEAGMKLGWYFSPMDWRDPDCRTAKNQEFVKRMQAELRELLSNYGKIDILWFDKDGRSAPWDAENTYDMVRELQPDIVINERLDLGDQGGWSEGFIGPRADFHTPEQTVGSFDQRPWESCMTVSKKSQWSWGGKSDGVKSSRQCLDMLIRCAGGDGNLLLNVGPTPSGLIDPEQVSVIQELGHWLETHGKSIYGTRGGPWKPGKYAVSTYSGYTIWLHMMKWPGTRFILPNLPVKILSASTLEGQPVHFIQKGDSLSLDLPTEKTENRDLIIQIQTDHPVSQIEPINMQFPSQAISIGKQATASNVFQNLPLYSAGRANDDIEETRWATDAGTTEAWLEYDLGSTQKIGRALLIQAYPELNRIREYSIEYWQDGRWISCYQGTNPGEIAEISFLPIQARRVRLHITDAVDGPTLFEFQVFSASLM